MTFVECLHAGAESCSDELFRMIWYAVILYTSSGNDSQLPALMWLDLHIDISLGLPCRYLGEAEFRHSGQYLHFELAAVNVTSYHRCWTDYDVSSGGYWHCMHYAWGIFLNYYVYLLQHLPTATFTDCYTRRFFSVLWWTRYTAALCCFCACWNQSSDAH